MKILLHGLNYAPEKVGIAVYTTGMAEYLADLGHEVRVVAGQPYYPQWRIMSGHKAGAFSRSFENGVQLLRVPHFIPHHPTGVRRVLHHLTFGIASLLPMLWQAARWRPDIVIAVAPSLLATPVARLASGLAGASSWLHIQDFEVDAAEATGLLQTNSPGARAARGFEALMLRSFETVSTISPPMCRALLDKGVAPSRVVEFRNWADLVAIVPQGQPSPFRSRWGINTEHVALYAGNIANKQGIDLVVDAARQLRHRRDLTFVICGDGPNRSRLEQQAADLDNIVFQPLQEREDLNDLMGLASVHLLPQLAEVADLVLPSKLTNMLASGRPIVATASPGTGLHDEVTGCGIVTPPGDAEAFAQGIVRLLDDAAERTTLGRAARSRAVQRWDKARILGEFARRLEIETRKLAGSVPRGSDKIVG